MGCTAQNPERPEGEESATDAVFSSLLEDTAEELYESAPCGYLSTLMDGTIARINGTLLDWIGLTREEVVGRRRFTDLLTIGGKLYHETHFAPLLRMQGKISEIAMELNTIRILRIVGLDRVFTIHPDVGTATAHRPATRRP